jgi:hypothetical protein
LLEQRRQWAEELVALDDHAATELPKLRDSRTGTFGGGNGSRGRA